MRGTTLAPTLLACLLAGCVASGGGSGRPVAVLEGDLRVAAPRGYCIDPSSRQEKDDSALLLAGRCAGETGAVPALLTATIGPAGSAAGIDPATDSARIAAFFTSDRGRTALSRRGRAKDVTIAQMAEQEGALLLRLTDSGHGNGMQVQAESWRALLPLDGRLVTLTVSGMQAAPLSAEAGHRLIGDFATAMRRANP